MIKSKSLLSIFICILLLTGCSKPDLNKKEREIGVVIPPASKTSDEIIEKIIVEDKTDSQEEINIQEEAITILQPDLITEEGIKEYLIGEWILDKQNISEVTCNMSIDESLNINLIFDNPITGEYIGAFYGYIEFDRQYANSDEVPDLLVINLINTDYPGGVYFFLHRTIYDGKQVMSLFFAVNGNGIFDMLGDIDNFEYGPEEVIFEKNPEYKSQLQPIKNQEFHAVFWGMGHNDKSLWLDEVKWTPIEEYDPDQLYPDRITLRE